MTIEIECDVPLPQNLSPRGRSTVWPFKMMKVGDSFEVPKERAEALRRAIGPSAKYYRMRLISRLQPDGALRCWRAPDTDPFSD